MMSIFTDTPNLSIERTDAGKPASAAHAIRWATSKCMQAAAAFLLIVVGTCAQAAQRADSCQAQIPKTLATAVAAAFAGYRTPLETDNLPEDIEYNRAHGGTGCLGVAVADFNGDHAKDYLLGLTAVEGDSGLAVIALSSKSGWRFHKIRSWVEDVRNRQYVAAVKPGKHDRTEALDGPPLDTGERVSMRCPRWGALVGATESTGVVYCYMDGQWPHVVVSD
jgi:hypothetical protein